MLFVIQSTLIAQNDDYYPPYYSPILQRDIETNPSLLLKITGRYGVWYKKTDKQNFGGDRITRPFIICEGFDVVNNLEFPDLYEQLNNNSSITRKQVGDDWVVDTYKEDGFLDDLRCAGYDVIILDLGSNTKAIQENAELFIKLIKEIDDEVKLNAANNGTFY